MNRFKYQRQLEKNLISLSYYDEIYKYEKEIIQKAVR